MLDAASQLENDEYADVLIAIDGQLFGLDGNDYVVRDYGGGDNDGWQTVTIDIGNLSAGPHTVTLGGFLNKKTHSNEDAFIKFSDVEIAGAVPVGEDTGDDALYGGAGDDSLVGGAGNDTLEGGTGNDILDGGTGNDTLDGGEGFFDTLTGGAGNDSLTDADGVLEAQGGDGNDVIDITFDAAWDNDENGATDPASTNRISGGTGADIITVTMASLGFAIALDADEASATDDDGNDKVTLKGLYATSQVDLGGGNDIFIGGNGADTVEGGLGKDDIKGGRGDDILYGGDGNDRLRGQAGNDTLYGGDGVDRLQGGGGNDVLRGGEGADRLEGGNGNDTLFFDPGLELITNFGTFSLLEDSLVTGGRGIDTLQGSAGNDLIDFNESALFTDIEIVRAGAGDDLIIGKLDTSLSDQFLVFGGEGDDIVSFFSVTTTNLDLSHIDPSFNSTTGAWTIDYTGGGAQSVTLSQAEVVASVGGNVGNWDPSVGLSGNFPGSPNFLSANYIDGGSGQNTLFGSEGSDIVFGGVNTTDQSPDAAFDDYIYGLGGNDILVGGSGYDTYYVARGEGDDFIFDGNTRVGTEPQAYSNGLAIFAGFDNDGNRQEGDVSGDNYTDQGGGVWTTGDSNGQNGVTFTKNGDGTWTISFNEGSGSVTFASAEISEIQLFSTDSGGATTVRKDFVYDSVNDEYDEGTTPVV